MLFTGIHGTTLPEIRLADINVLPAVPETKEKWQMKRSGNTDFPKP